VMEGSVLLNLPEGMRLDQIQITEQGLLIEVRATSPTSCCPTNCATSCARTDQLAWWTCVTSLAR